MALLSVLELVSLLSLVKDILLSTNSLTNKEVERRKFVCKSTDSLVFAVQPNPINSDNHRIYTVWISLILRGAKNPRSASNRSDLEKHLHVRVRWSVNVIETAKISLILCRQQTLSHFEFAWRSAIIQIAQNPDIAYLPQSVLKPLKSLVFLIKGYI